MRTEAVEEKPNLVAVQKWKTRALKWRQKQKEKQSIGSKP
jgi:hypothetical protein